LRSLNGPPSIAPRLTIDHVASCVACSPCRLLRWLRPDYQVPRFGSTKDKLALTGGAMHEPAAASSGPKPSFPTSELEQTAAVLSVLSSVTEPASATALAVRFRQGRRVLPQVEAVLAALLRVGGLVTTPDAGRSFLPRRAA
jgi:hypothetical protein